MILLGAPPAFGAEEEVPDPDFSVLGTRRAGPFHYRPFLELRDAGHDDNVFLDARDPEADASATLGGGIRALIRTGRAGGFHLYQRFDYVGFREHGELNHWNDETRAKGAWWNRHLLLSLEESYLRVEERPNTEVDARLLRRNHTVTGALRTLSQGRFGLGLRLTHDRVEYPAEDPEAEAVGRGLNRESGAAALAAEVRILPKTTVVVEGILEDVEFRERTGLPETRSLAFLPGLRFDPSARIGGKIRFGRQELDAPGRPDLGYRGWVGDAALTAPLGSTGRARAGYRREIHFSTLEDNLYFLEEGWTAGYEQFFSRRISVAGEFGKGVNDYPQRIEATGSDPFSGFRKDRLTDTRLELRYRVEERLTWTAGWSRHDRDSNDEVNDLARDLFTVGARWEF